MTSDPYLLFLMFGVPAIAIIVFFVLGFCRMGTLCSREEERSIDAAALEGDLTHYIRALNKGEVA